MLRVAILDDYQNVSQKYGNWRKLEKKIYVKAFNKFIHNRNSLVKNLLDFDVVCLMRERTKFGKDVISKLPNLKLVITSGNWNTSVDKMELTKRKIYLYGTDNRIQSTAELSWLLTMNVWRNVFVEFDNMINNKWQTTIGRTLFGKTLGIFGLGKQGRQVANFGKAFGMKVLAWSHNLKKIDCIDKGVEFVTSEDLFKFSDVLSIHTKLSERTRGFIDKKKISLMKKTSIIINTSRGPIINESDLIFAIKNKLISGVGLDVFDVEPLPKNHILRNLMKKYNVLLTPHLGYVSSETYEKFHQGYVDVVETFLKGKPMNIIN